MGLKSWVFPLAVVHKYQAYVDAYMAGYKTSGYNGITDSCSRCYGDCGSFYVGLGTSGNEDLRDLRPLFINEPQGGPLAKSGAFALRSIRCKAKNTQIQGAVYQKCRGSSK